MLSKMLRICGYYEFGFRDLQAPNGRRFKRQLSALINFMKYREDMGHLLETALDERVDMFNALEEMAEEHMTLQDRLEVARSENHAKMLEQDAAEAECQEMEAEIAQQNKIQASIRQQNNLLQKSANDLKDQIANLSIALRELQAEERQLSKEVVHSPDRIKLDLAMVTKSLEDVKAMIGEREEERKLMMKRVENTMAGEECVRRTMTVMEEMETKVQEYEVVVEDLEDVQGRLEEMERGVEDNTRVKGEQEMHLRALEKQRLDITDKLSKELESSKNELTTATNKLGIVEDQRLDGIAKIEASQKRVEELEAHIEKEKKRTENEISARIASFHKFEKGFLAKEKMTMDRLLCA
eukprot:g8763.t1 g8763   contig34:45082-46637(-)